MGESLPGSPVQAERSKTWPYKNSEYKTFIVRRAIPSFGE